MAKTKTTVTGASVADYLEARGAEEQQKDAHALIQMMRAVTRQEPKMWGPSIVGFGSYHYVYPSGHSGDAPIAGFAIRGREIVIYLADDDARDALLARLGPHRTGKCCLYVKRLGDLDKAVLKELIRSSVAEMRRRYGGPAGRAKASARKSGASRKSK